MTKPTLNFVWVGAPKFNKGGHDVIGPETIDRNFKTFPPPDLEPNPMVFWCQAAYQEKYSAWFSSRDISIDVRAIETYLDTRATDMTLTQAARDEATLVSQYYHELLLAPDRGTTVDCVYMKDMFFNYILATQGHYVLDTNIWAYPDAPVCFPDYSTYMFPIIHNDDKTKDTEVWLQYAPPNSTRAQTCLTSYLTLYDEWREWSKDDRADQMGRIAVDALYKRPNGYTARNQSLDGSYETWSCSHINAFDIRVPDLVVFKEYANSHKKNREHAYAPAHCHALSGDLYKLQFDLDHGIYPDAEANPKESTEEGLGYDATNETLLHTTMRYSSQLKNRSCAQLLLEKGADANKIHEIQFKHRPKREESPLTYAIKGRSEAAIRLLFDYAVKPVNPNQILNNVTPLMLAVRCKNGVALLLEKGADPNQVLPNQDKNALSLALERKDLRAVDLLLNYGANPLAIIHTTKGDETIEQQMSDIVTSEECSTRLSIVIEESPRKIMRLI